MVENLPFSVQIFILKNTFMKTKRLLSTLAFLAGASAALFAQYDPSLRPKADGQWDFENEADLTANTIAGSVINIEKGLAGENSFTIGENGMVQSEGPSAEDRAITVQPGDIFKMNVGTTEEVSNYTMMWNVRINTHSYYHALLQTNPDNHTDGDLFINKSGQVGLGIGGFGYGGYVTLNEWHTIVITVKDGCPTTYMDGQILVEGSYLPSFYNLQNGYALIFCDENNEYNTLEVSQLAYWSRALTFEEIFPPIADTGDHNYVNGICKDEGCQLPYEAPELVDDVYQIGNAGNLFWFAQRVNSGFANLNAALTSDIDLENLPWTPIRECNDSKPYKGTFDGKGFTISNFLCDGPAQGTSTVTGDAFIAGLGVGAVLQNLTIKGQIVTNGGRGGVVAYADTDSKIYNVHSYLDIDIRAEGSNECGGVIGSLRTDAWIDNCAFYGTITVNCNSGDSYGGVAGYSNNGIISNCANYGELVCKTEWDKCELAGIVGRAKSAFYRLYNCLSVGKISTVAPSPLYMNAIVGKYECSNPSQIVNNYYLEGSTPGCEGNMDDALATAVDASQLASGAVACKLNGSEFSFDPVWYQNAEEDLYPVLDNTHGLPYTVGENSGSINDDASYAAFRDLLVEDIRQNCEQKTATQSLIDTMNQMADQIAQTGTLEDFRAIFDEYMSNKKAYAESVQAYADYAAKAQEAILFLEEHQDIEGAYRQLVEEYLNEAVEPGTFPNGSYSYIMEQHTLSTEEIKKETEYIDILLNQAVNGGYVAGSDITSLVTNPTFSQGSEGWTGTGCEYNTSLPIVQAWGTTFDLSQTFTDLKNGVYEVKMNALYRAAEDDNSRFYTSYIYANGNITPIMNTQEDPISMDEAEDGVNCYITEAGTYPYDFILNEKYYYPNSLDGAAIAFKAGRYENRVIVNVTDGKLTIGIRGEGTNNTGYDWTAFNNVRLYYQGEIAEAEEAITNTLSQQVERAEILLTAEISSGEDYGRYPNFSKALREELQATVSAAASASDAQAAYELTEKFSALFAQIQDCQKGYIEMLTQCNTYTDTYNDLYTLGIITEDEYNQIINTITGLFMQYESGDIAAEDIPTILESLKPQVKNPAPDARWTFEDASNFMANAVADSPFSIEPGTAGSNSYTLGENTISATAGPGYGDEGAVTIHKGDMLQLNLDNTEDKGSYTLMWNIRIPVVGNYYCLLQTYANNEDDATIFINKNGQIGRAVGNANFYSSTSITPSEWHRIVVTVDNGVPTSYMDGKFLKTGNQCDFFYLHEGRCLIFCDNDGEYNEMEVSEIAYWNRTLVDVEIEKYFADYQQNINDNTVYPEPTAQFDFNASAPLFNATNSAQTMQTGKLTENVYGQEDFDLETISGMDEEDGAVRIHGGEVLQFNLGSEEEVNDYTMMWNVRIPDFSSFRGLLQTDNQNADDSQMFINSNSAIGRGTIFGYGGSVSLDTWHHIMLVVRNGVACAYLDGVRVASGLKAHNAYTLNGGKCMLFCDNDGEVADIDVTQFAYWNRGLTNEEVSIHYADYKEHMTTGIESVAAEGTQTGNKLSGIYNLMGQKVKNPTKGLYIINGKKTIVK